MSASSKKKLRNEQNAQKLTEKQLAEQKEAKKLKIMTTIVVILVIATAVFAIWSAVTNTLENSGIRERNTIALTVGDHKISNAELNYFYIDSIQGFLNNYGSYATMFGLDMTKPLDQQYVNEEEGITWADDFLTSAKETAKTVYAITDEAKANGYTLSEAELLQIKTEMSRLDLYALQQGTTDTNAYMKAIYGNGATEESLREYYELTLLAESYLAHYRDSFSYTDDQIRAAEAENYEKYSSFSYNYYYLTTSKFEENGTEDEKADPAAAAKAAAEAMVAAGYTTVEEFNDAIAQLSINASSTNAASTDCSDTSYNNVSSLYRDWIADSSRAAGDMEFFENTSTDDNGTETVNGYYVVFYTGSNDNKVVMSNVRHILVKFAGGTTDESGNTTYSAEEISTAKAKAEALLDEWKSGDATEESFAELANTRSEDGDGTTGGLYENIVYSSNYVENFLNWAIDESRQVGDTEVIETEYGFHVMYFSGHPELNYRDYQISEELRSADFNKWYTALIEAMPMTEGQIKYINTGLVLSAG